MRILLLLLALLCAPAFAFQPVLGEVTPSVTPSNIKSTICAVGYTDTVRPNSYYTGVLKGLLAGGDEAAARACIHLQYGKLHHWRRAVYACAQALPVTQDRLLLAQYELDHKVPLEVGGHPDSPNNLWLEPVAEARIKDRLENSVKRDVCAGRLPLRQGQRKFIEPLPTK